MARRLEKHGRGGRERLLKAATRLFIEHGYEGTPVSRIVREAGVTMPVLYYHFGNKRDLLCVVIASRGNWFRTGLSADPTRPFAEYCEAIVNQAVENIEEVRDGLRLRIQLDFASGDDADKLRDLVHQQRLRALSSIGGTMARALPSPTARRAGWLAELFLVGVQSLALEVIGTNGPPRHFNAKVKSLVRSLIHAANMPEQELPELTAEESP